ncbi:MAG: WD40 repeat domain-containing protein, partial [Nostoc sp.]
VYTIPLALTFSNDSAELQHRLGGGVTPKVLPMIPVRLRSGEIFPQGLTMLWQMVLARAFPDILASDRLGLITEVFDSLETLDRLCLISGGHVRDLLGLLFDCLREQDPPFERECVELVIRVNGVAWSPDGKAIASVSIDSTVKIWNRDGDLLSNLAGDGDSFISVSFSPDGKTLAASSDDKVRIWNREGTLLIALKGNKDELTSVSFSHDGKTLAAGSANGAVILQNLADIQLEKLLIRSCDLLHDYLNTNQKVMKSDGSANARGERALCSGR